MRLNKFLLATTMTLIVVPAAHADYADQIFKKSSSTPDVSGSFKHTVDQIQSKSAPDVFKKTVDGIKEKPAESTFEVRPSHVERDYAAIVEQLNRQIVLDSKNSMLYAKRAEAHHKLHDYSGALSDIRQAILLDPKDWRYYRFRAGVHSALKEYDQQLSDISIALRLNADRMPAAQPLYVNRSGCYELLHQYDKGLADANKAISLDPTDPYGYVSRAISLVEYKEFAKAIDDCNKAIQLNSKCADAYEVRARAEGRLGNAREAERDIRTGENLDGR